MPQPYLRQVNSSPKKVSADIWRQWYLEQHLREMVHYGVVTNSALYRKSSPVFTSGNAGTEDSDRMPFLAIYQSNRDNCVDCPEYKDNVRQGSVSWDASLTLRDVAEISLTQLKLVEVLGSYEHTEEVAPHVVHVHYTGEEVEGNIQFEHVNAVSILEGYRRTLLYRPTHPAGGLPSIVLIHEFETFDPSDLPFVKKEMQSIEPTKDCSFTLRAFSLLGCEGFGGTHQIPEPS